VLIYTDIPISHNSHKTDILSRGRCGFDEAKMQVQLKGGVTEYK